MLINLFNAFTDHRHEYIYMYIYMSVYVYVYIEVVMIHRVETFARGDSVPTLKVELSTYIYLNFRSNYCTNIFHYIIFKYG